MNPGRFCVMRSLENPMLNGILLGLDVRDHDLHVLPDLFPCCKGEGSRHDERQNAMLRCALKVRFEKTFRVLESFYRHWGADQRPPHFISPARSARILSDVSAVLKGNKPQAHLLKGEKEKPSELYAMALACTWRFGVDVHVANFTKDHSNALFPSEEILASGRPLALFIEQVDGLWEAQTANQFEALVALAYRANAYLWVEFLEATPVTDTSHSTKAAFRRRIAELKARSPLSFLERSCTSRLETMCALPRLADTGAFHG